MSSQNQQRDFRELLAQELRLPEAEMGLDRAALYLSGAAYPSLNPQRYVEQLDALAAQVQEAAGAAAGPEALVRALHRHLFETLGFAGNPSDYYNPDNSYLNRVLDTRLGIPIALSVVYLEAARRLGVDCRGVGLPGHFVVYVTPLELYLDPFHGGQLLSAGDCRRLVQDMFGARAPWREEFLEPYAKRDIIFRMLTNLKQIFLERRDYRQAAATLEQMTWANPEAPFAYRELGWCYLRLEQPQQALQCLERYLKLDPGSGDAGLVRRQVQALQAVLGQTN